MKNIKKFALAALMVVVMAFALSACGSANVDGKYVVFEADGKSVDDAIKLYEAAGQSLTAEQICTITLSGGENFSMTVMGQSMGEGTYKVSGDTISLTVDGSTMDAELKDGVLTITVGAQNMKLKKQ